MITVTEVTHHGDYRHSRTVELVAVSPSEVARMLRDCPYYYTSERAIGEVYEGLTRDGRAEWGWTRWQVDSRV